MPDQTRRDMRTPITLKIKFKSSNLDQFIERYSVDVSRGGIFIRTKEPLPVGTQLRFEFQLQDASSLIAGDGTVVWIREHDPARQGVAPGMGVRFDKLAADSQKVLDRILSEKQKRGDAQLESRFDAGVRASASASGTLSSAGRVAGHNDFSGGDSRTATPLPGAIPGLAAPDDEFGNESTRVMQNELVQSLADKTRGQAEDAANAFSEPEPTRKASVEELKLAVQGSAIEKASEPEPKPRKKRQGRGRAAGRGQARGEKRRAEEGRAEAEAGAGRRGQEGRAQEGRGQARRRRGQEGRAQARRRRGQEGREEAGAGGARRQAQEAQGRPRRQAPRPRTASRRTARPRRRDDKSVKPAEKKDERPGDRGAAAARASRRRASARRRAAVRRRRGGRARRRLHASSATTATTSSSSRRKSRRRNAEQPAAAAARTTRPSPPRRRRRRGQERQAGDAPAPARRPTRPSPTRSRRRPRPSRRG